jgi:metal-responsive CopG/Arc/MetJ family transcriptional regulator
MKTAVSIPDDLFRELEAWSRRMRISRSAVLAAAAREYLSRHRAPEDATTAWNRAIAKAGQPGDDPAAQAARSRSRRVIRGSAGQR